MYWNDKYYHFLAPKHNSCDAVQITCDAVQITMHCLKHKNVQNYDDKPFTMTTEANVYVSCSILTHTMRGLNAKQPNNTYHKLSLGFALD
jgi:hypothetical protein